VQVEDTGPGIAPDGLERLFEPFYTTKGTGMGMGLAISQTIAEDHGGRIWAESTLGQGTCFHLVLPLAEGTAEAEAEAGQDGETA
jgi:signal transduction histidine kinase